MRRTFFHIGLHKTGTTFLQNEVFQVLSGIHVLKPGSTSLKRLTECPRDMDCLVSDEALSGMPWGKSFDLAGGWRRARELSLVNIAEFFPSAEIIVCFRPHSALTESLYRQYLHEGGAASFGDFFGRNGLIQKRDVEFTPFLEMIEELLPNAPFVFSAEELWSNPSDVIRRMCLFLGVEFEPGAMLGRPRNRGVRGYRARVLRSLNRISRSELNPGGFFNLRNRLFRRLAIDPRSICQNFLPGDWGQGVGLDAEFRHALEAEFAEDWEGVLQRIRRCRARFRETTPTGDAGNDAFEVSED